jgi:hypothetical protein
MHCVFLKLKLKKDLRGKITSTIDIKNIREQNISEKSIVVPTNNNQNNSTKTNNQIN